jgi:hypothetical protein
MAKERAYAAIDFGTTQTAAAVWVEGAEPHLIALDGRVLNMPSAVFHNGGTQLLVGRPALRALQSAPLRGERTPKRKLRHGSSFIDFDGPQFAMVDVVGQILGEVYRRVEEEIGRAPDAVCLTRPVTWREGGIRQRALRAAANLGGIECPIVMVSEAEAAARHLGAGLDKGDVCLVYDLGGGTCDIAVMEMTRNGLDLRGEDEQEIGGETFDDLLLWEMISRVAREDPPAGQRLQEVVLDPLADVVGHEADLPDTLKWRRCMASLGKNVRTVKEKLSTRTEADLLVPRPVNSESVVTRAELEQLVADDLQRTGESVRRCVDNSHLSPDVAYLAGAASAMPAVSQVVRNALSLSPVLPRNPKGAIALGGVRMVAEPLVKAERARERKRLRAEQERLKAQRAAAKRKAAGERAAAKRKAAGERAAAKRKAAAERAAAERKAAGERAAALEARRQRILNFPEGKRLSKEKLAELLTEDETLDWVTTCVPPRSVLRNGMLMLTSQRVVWVRQTFTGSPEPTSIERSKVSSVTTEKAGPNFYIAKITVGHIVYQIGEISESKADALRRSLA